MAPPTRPDNCRIGPCPPSPFRLQSGKPREGAMSSNLEHAATDPGGPTGRLATWLAGLTLDAVPAKTRERAKYLILDGIACAIVGAQLPWSRLAVELATDLEGSGDATLIGWGKT